MDLVILEKIESSILNGLGYIVRLEKKNGNKSIIWLGGGTPFFNGLNKGKTT